MTQEHTYVRVMSKRTTSKLTLQLDASSGKHRNWAQGKDEAETQHTPNVEGARPRAWSSGQLFLPLSVFCIFPISYNQACNYKTNRLKAFCVPDLT